MSKRSLSLYLKDILFEIERAERFLKGISSAEELSKDEKTFYAMVKVQENIGKAVKHIPDNLRVMYSAIPWKEIVAFRNILVHEYFGISPAIVFNVVEKELPALKEAVLKILEEVEEDEG